MLPSAELAYETGSSAGSIAVEPSLGVAPSWIAYRANASLTMLWGAKKLASLTGFAPVISCMRGRHVDWLHHRDRNGEGRRIRAFDLMHVKHPL